MIWFTSSFRLMKKVLVTKAVQLCSWQAFILYFFVTKNVNKNILHFLFNVTLSNSSTKFNNFIFFMAVHTEFFCFVYSKTIRKLLISAASSLFNHIIILKRDLYKNLFHFVTTSQCEIFYWLATSILFVNRLLTSST